MNDTRTPIDLPDDFGIEEGPPRFGAAFIISAGLWAVLIIGGALIWRAFA